MPPIKRRIDRNRKAEIKRGDTYRVGNVADLIDVDGDGSADLTLTHTTTRNGQLFFETKTVWYGIDPMLADAFRAQLQPYLGEDIVVRSFGALVRHWRTLNKIMDKVTEVGKEMAEAIGEQADD